MIIIITPPEKFSGELTTPGDKSITHRALMLGAISRGITEVSGFLESDDIHSTIKCLRSLGVRINKRAGKLLITGHGMKLRKPSKVLDAGNSGTTARLLLGILAGQSFQSTLTGDHSLKKRPMKRVVEPLEKMGATFNNGAENLPLTIMGGDLNPVEYKTPRASAQIKSALLLAGLYAKGETIIEEPHPSRNHTELMLEQFGAEIETEGCRIAVKGRPVLKGQRVTVPGDISAAAFMIVAAAIIPGSEVLIKDVGINPLRSGVIDVLTKMGANIEIRDENFWGQEMVADIVIRGGNQLEGVTIEGEMIPRLIDEIPALVVAAAVAKGKTIIKDADELRVKESDRISVLAGQFAKLGVNITEKEDGMIIEGGAKLTGANVDSCGDHRLAMALAVAGLVAEGETAVNNAEVINVSFPGFMAALRSLITG